MWGNDLVWGIERDIDGSWSRRDSQKDFLIYSQIDLSKTDP
jgi:hypothetical protein